MAREDAVQAAIVAYCRAVLPDCRVMAIPNGGLRSKREAAKLKWTGVLAGAPDLVLALPIGQVLWIEVKGPGGSRSREQRDLHADLDALGHAVVVAKSIDDVRAALAEAGIITREARAA